MKSFPGSAPALVPFPSLPEPLAIIHLQTRHPKSLAGLTFAGEPDRVRMGLPPRFLGSRAAWDSLHEWRHNNDLEMGHSHVDEVLSMSGKSILEMMWDELDDAVAALMRGQSGRRKGRVQGIAACVAIITDPYRPKTEPILAEAQRRWEVKQ